MLTIEVKFTVSGVTSEKIESYESLCEHIAQSFQVDPRGIILNEWRIIKVPDGVKIAATGSFTGRPAFRDAIAMG